MCGIFCFISKTDFTGAHEEILSQCQCHLQNRGPDETGRLKFDSRVLLLGTVLWQQGATPCRQPVEDDRFALLFNGDLFMERDGPSEDSDTRWLFQQIVATRGEAKELRELFGVLKGPFSLVLLDKVHRRVYFGRDCFGRNSLLVAVSDDGIVVSTVLGNKVQQKTVELPPNGIYYVDLSEDNLDLHIFPWNTKTEESESALNVTFEDPIELPWLHSVNSEISFNYHDLLRGSNVEPEQVFNFMLSNSAVSNLCHDLIRLLEQSVRERVVNTPLFCRKCLPLREPCPHPRLGILFSGGIDCTIIALLADRFVPESTPIDLLNVAFEKIFRPNGKKHPSTIPPPIDWNVPDRVTGRSTLQELQRLRPNRHWNFVEINITRQELNDHKRRISDLVFPLKSVLDESIGAALWFASRGHGTTDEAVGYRCDARVLLLGSGADELFGGYSRHRVAFYRDVRSKDGPSDAEVEQGFRSLAAELELDWNRLPSRNLARDDRVIGDHGITPRTPYLQEDFVALVHGLGASQRCYYPLGAGIGDKLTLRLCGYRLGLRVSTCLRKRALQFGSRIADRKQNAADESTFLSEG
ncbi:asparagine synthetase [Culex quinquefasciatus]|uniref:Asparagine synthetase n=1 Tax=Culex quinquefasciatus TaxID=7176 RepID=B0WP11_CULQU|nr:asparagine synthetase [Culex quinquefasciatus]|eukprot:XP_001850445.1 asparagine synthetase [Culex quinquefasciatus]